jgi:hypothetical protein
MTLSDDLVDLLFICFRKGKRQQMRAEERQGVNLYSYPERQFVLMEAF